MKEFADKVPYGWWELFRSRCMTNLDLTYDQWQNRYSGRTPLTPAERLAMQQIFDQIKKEMDV